MAKWREVKMGDVCLIERGGSPRPIDKYITQEKNGINWIKIGDTNESMYITSTAQKIIPEGMKKSRYVQPGDFLLSNSMSFGRPYILAIDGCIHDGWLVLRDINNVFDKHFLYYYLSAPITYQKFKSLAVGGVVNNLNSEMVRNIKVALPPLEEQRKIAAVLDKVSDLIAKRRQQLEKLDLLVKARFVEMFGDININDKGWDVKPLGELCTIVRGGSPRPIEKYLGGDIPWIKIGDATDDENIYLHSTKEHIIKEGISKSRLVKSGSLIFANCGVSLGFARIITFDGCIHDGWLAMEDIDESLDKVFLLQALNQMTQHFREIAPAGTQPNLNTSIMKSYLQVVPPLELQREFIDFYTGVNKLKITIKQGFEQLKLLKKALMQEYF